VELHPIIGYHVAREIKNSEADPSVTSRKRQEARRSGERDVTGRAMVYVVNRIGENDAQHYVYVIGLLKRLEQLGWKTHLLSEKGGRGERAVFSYPVQFLSDSDDPSRYVKLALSLISLRRQGVRIVFVRISWAAALVAAIVGRPIGMKVIYWLSGTVEDFNDQQPWIRRTISRMRVKAALKLCDHFATGPKTMVDYYIRTWNVPRRKIVMLFNDIDVERFRPAARIPSEGSSLRVLLLHRLSPVRETARYMKSIMIALSKASCDAGRQVELIIAGDGPERKAVEEAVRDLNYGSVVVRFLGEVPNRTVVSLYGSADVFIMPSYREGFPRVILEAMAAGLPIVATDAGGTAELVGPKQRRFIVPRDFEEEFGKRLHSLLMSVRDRAEVADENRAEVMKFDTSAVARMYDAELSLIGAAQ
jgi:glycosyltransferase involved in cell wall biosynthesis